MNVFNASRSRPWTSPSYLPIADPAGRVNGTEIFEKRIPYASMCFTLRRIEYGQSDGLLQENVVAIVGDRSSSARVRSFSEFFEVFFWLSKRKSVKSVEKDLLEGFPRDYCSLKRRITKTRHSFVFEKFSFC